MRLFLTLFALLVAWPTPTHAQAEPVPSVVADFIATPHLMLEPAGFMDAMRDALWNVYPLGDESVADLESYVRRGEDGPGVAFAAIALIGFKEPSSTPVILERALDPATSVPTRWYLLNAAPYSLGMGDVMFVGGDSISDRELASVEYLMARAESAIATGTGRAHALKLREIRDALMSDFDNDGLAMSYWHQSAYLIGTLDLRDFETLRPCIDPNDGRAFVNIMSALRYATGQEFSALERSENATSTRELAQYVADQAVAWWEAYLEDNPDGAWLPAVVESVRAAGYPLSTPVEDASNDGVLLRATLDGNPQVRYSAHRILNHSYGTNFDLDRAFLGGKYAMSFMDPTSEMYQVEARMRKYWHERLSE